MFVSALVAILFLIALIAAIVHLLVGPPHSERARFLAWFCLVASAVLCFISGGLPSPLRR
jgi:hypothetical protein